MTRRDLLALGPTELAQIANVGLVARAQRELAEGAGPALELREDGTLVARRGAIETVLPAGVGFAEGHCSCGARGLCRHLVMAVLAYREEAGSERAPGEAWSAAEIDDDALRAHLGRRTLRRAEARREEGLTAEVIRDARPPRVELPTCTVRFLVPRELGYARCDCRSKSPCAHVALAVWAFRAARALDPEAPRVHVVLGPSRPAPRRALDEALDLTRQLVLDGAEGSGAALAARFARAEAPLAEARLRWPLEICTELNRALEDYAARRATHHPGRVAALATELHARARAAERDAALSARAILGLDEPERTRLEDLRLVSLGARVRRLEALADGGARVGVEVFLADPDTAQVLVLRREWEVERDGLGATLARRPVLRGVSLGALARGQMVTRAASRRASREIDIARAARSDTSVTPQLGAWERLGDALCAPGAEALARRLDARPPAVLRPRVLADRVVAVAVRGVREIGWHAGEQTLRARLVDRAGGELHLELEHAPERAQAVEVTAGALREGPRFVSGEVRRRAGRLCVDPSALVTDRVIVPDLEAADGLALPRAGEPPRTDPIAEALESARRLLDEAAHRGLRHVRGPWLDEREATRARLDELGLGRCAAALAAVGAGPGPAEPDAAGAWLDASLRVALALELGA